MIMRGIAGILCGVLAFAFTETAPVAAFAQASDDAGSLELVDPEVFRACGDPRNLPFSNEKGEGFENKLAELFAAKLGKKLGYTYFPQAMGFVRNTLGSHRCDVIMGFPQGSELAQVTIPYYRTTYALVSKPGGGTRGREGSGRSQAEGETDRDCRGDAAEHQYGDQWPDGARQILPAGDRYPGGLLGAGDDR